MPITAAVCGRAAGQVRQHERASGVVDQRAHRRCRHEKNCRTQGVRRAREKLNRRLRTKLSTCDQEAAATAAAGWHTDRNQDRQQRQISRSCRARPRPEIAATGSRRRT